MQGQLLYTPSLKKQCLITSLALNVNVLSLNVNALSLITYFVASGVMTVFGVRVHTTGSEVFSDFLLREIDDLAGWMWVFEPDPLEMTQTLISRLDTLRKGLGINVKRERMLYDMAMRRELEAI